MFSLIPAFIQSATGFGQTETQKPPYLATASWRKQAVLERIERMQMQRQTAAFNAVHPGANIRRRAQPAPATPFVANAQHLEVLLSMGFERARAETALRQTNNDLEQATNNLLSS